MDFGWAKNKWCKKLLLSTVCFAKKLFCYSRRSKASVALNDFKISLRNLLLVLDKSFVFLVALRELCPQYCHWLSQVYTNLCMTLEFIDSMLASIISMVIGDVAFCSIIMLEEIFSVIALYRPWIIRILLIVCNMLDNHSTFLFVWRSVSLSTFSWKFATILSDPGTSILQVSADYSRIFFL